MEFKYIIYKTTNMIDNKFYIGVHKTLKPYEFDGYIGNGIYVNTPSKYLNRDTVLCRSIKKYGIENFKRETLYIFDTEEEAYECEARIVNEDFLK